MESKVTGGRRSPRDVDVQLSLYLSSLGHCWCDATLGSPHGRVRHRCVTSIVTPPPQREFISTVCIMHRTGHQVYGGSNAEAHSNSSEL